MLLRYSFLGVPLDYVAGDEAINHIEQFIEKRHAAKGYFLNAHCFNLSVEQPDYRRALHYADILLPDGVGMLWATRRLGLPHTENLNGSDFVPRLCKELVGRRGGLTVYLLGGRESVADKAGQKLAAIAPGLRVVGTHDGYFNVLENERIVDEINVLSPDIVLVGMGVPRQELWINQYAPRLRTGVVFGVGGLFDFLSERIRRAPTSVRRVKLEWAWRMGNEPTRLWKRYVLGNPMFVSRVMAGRWAGMRGQEPLLLDVRPTSLDLALESNKSLGIAGKVL